MQRVEDLNVLELQPLVPPRALTGEFPASERANATVARGRREVERVLRGEDPRLLVVAGPCSIHDRDLALDYAERLNGLRSRLADRLLVVMRVYFDKPRTTVGWRGFVNDPSMSGKPDLAAGLRATRELLLKVNELGLPVATEMLDPFVPQYLSDLIAWGAIGARTTESQTHRAMSSGLSMPIGFKNSTEGNVQVAVDAVLSASRPHSFLGIDADGRASVVLTRGNAHGHVILRGGRAGPNFDPHTVADAGRRLRAAGLPPALMVDCSHHNSGYDHARQALAWRSVLAQRAAGNADLVGLMLESNVAEGKQAIPADPSGLAYGVSVTDPCVGWEETEALLEEAHRAMAGAEGRVAVAG